jgi:hypothetical protein
MSFKFEPNLFYRMPVHFGPTPGPRQGPDGRPFDWSRQPQRTLVVAPFLSTTDALQALMPEGFSVEGEPVVTVEIQYWTQLAWLAGRGYNTLGVKFPARYRGQTGEWHGHFLAVIWENMPDAIISGREELGYNKIFAAIPPPRIVDGAHHYSADWFGHTFLDLRLDELGPAPVGEAPRVPGDGIMHYKYVPRTGRPGEVDAAYATLTPSGGSQVRLTACQTARASLRFHPSTWEQLPTTHHIVNVLAALPVVEMRAAYLVASEGGKDLSDQCIIA